MPRESFVQQVNSTLNGRPRIESTESQMISFVEDIERTTDAVTAPFMSAFEPSEMRQLALVAHNHMKPAMKEFIQTYSEVLKKFRITGTQTTMRMCKTLWGEDNPEIEYGLTCTSGPLGGDAQIASLMCMEDLGALIFFVDPLSAHPHQADIDSLVRLCNCGNVIVCPNPTSAMSMVHTLKCALEKGSKGMIPSFFETLESPAVAEYKAQQELALTRAVTGKSEPTLATLTISEGSETADSTEDGDEDEDEALDTVEEMQSFSSVSFAVDEAAPKINRTSRLYGIAPKAKKKSGMLKKIGKSLRKLGSS